MPTWRSIKHAGSDDSRLPPVSSATPAAAWGGSGEFGVVVMVMVVVSVGVGERGRECTRANQAG